MTLVVAPASPPSISVDSSRKRAVEGIIARLFPVWFDGIKPADLQVQVDGGALIITGRIPSFSAKQKLGQAIMMAAGCGEVIDLSMARTYPDYCPKDRRKK